MTFPILIEVEDSALGSVLKMLNGYPGIAKLHLDLDAVGGPKGHRKGVPKARKQRGPGEPSSTDIIIAFLMSGPKRNNDVALELERHGFAKASSASCLTALRDKGIVHGIGGMLWDLTDEAKARLAPQPPALPSPHLANGKTAHDLVLEKMKSLGGSANRLTLAQVLSENNLAASSISRVMSDLKQRGVITNDSGPGVYHLASEKKTKTETVKPERSEKRTAIVKFLKRRKGPQHINDIAAAIGATSGSINGAIWRLQQTGEVEKVSPGMFQLAKKNAAEEPSTATQE